jgi:hypothetical protein
MAIANLFLQLSRLVITNRFAGHPSCRQKATGRDPKFGFDIASCND